MTVENTDGPEFGRVLSTSDPAGKTGSEREVNVPTNAGALKDLPALVPAVVQVDALEVIPTPEGPCILALSWTARAAKARSTAIWMAEIISGANSAAGWVVSAAAPVPVVVGVSAIVENRLKGLKAKSFEDNDLLNALVSKNCPPRHETSLKPSPGQAPRR